MNQKLMSRLGSEMQKPTRTDQECKALQLFVVTFSYYLSVASISYWLPYLFIHTSAMCSFLGLLSNPIQLIHITQKIRMPFRFAKGIFFYCAYKWAEEEYKKSLAEMLCTFYEAANLNDIELGQPSQLQSSVPIEIPERASNTGISRSLISVSASSMRFWNRYWALKGEKPDPSEEQLLKRPPLDDLFDALCCDLAETEGYPNEVRKPTYGTFTALDGSHTLVLEGYGYQGPRHNN